MAEGRPLERTEPDSGTAPTVYHPDLEWRQTVRGAKPGDRFVRIATHRGFTRVGRTWCREPARANPLRHWVASCNG
jgi:hypothetical protein